MLMSGCLVGTHIPDVKALPDVIVRRRYLAIWSCHELDKQPAAVCFRPRNLKCTVACQLTFIGDSNPTAVGHTHPP